MNNDEKLLADLGLDTPVRPPIHPPPVPTQLQLEEKATCPFCREEIQPNAAKCKHCHEILHHVERARREIAAMPEKWNRGTAILLSILLPGAGDVYKGRPLGGIVWIPLNLAAYVCAWPIGIVMHLIAIASAASGDPKK